MQKITQILDDLGPHGIEIIASGIDPEQIKMTEDWVRDHSGKEITEILGSNIVGQVSISGREDYCEMCNVFILTADGNVHEIRFRPTIPGTIMVDGNYIC